MQMALFMSDRIGREYMKYIKQRHKYGCGVACLAMVTGNSYETVRRAFTFDAAKTGLTVQHMVHYLSSLGYWIQYKSMEPVGLINQQCTPMRSIADSHICMVQNSKTSKFHFVVVDSHGCLYDPADKTRTNLHNCKIISILGCHNRMVIGSNGVIE